MKKLSIVIVLLLLAAVVAGCNVKPTTSTAVTTKPSATTSVTTPPVTATSPATTTMKPVNPTKTPTPTTVQPSAQVSGTVYFRDPSVRFAIDADPAPYALEGATVSVSGYNIVSGEDGKYTIPCAPGFQTMTVTADGYIPTRVSWTFESGQSYAFNLGLYKAPETVTPRPDFINGIILWDAGGWLIDYYYKGGLFQPTFSYAKDNAGGNLITVSDPVFITSATNDHVTMSNLSMSGSWWRMMNETEYAVLVKDAHSKGLQFMLWLGVMDEGKTDYFKIVYDNSQRPATFWDDWFSEYEKYAVASATMAEKLGIEYFNLGHDMGYAIDGSRFEGNKADSFARWQKLITAVRAVYHGKLTYFGGMNFADDYYEDNGYPDGFVNLFDAVGINVQAINGAFNPSVDDLKNSILKLLDRYTSWERPVFIMIRTPSVDGGTSHEEFMEPLKIANNIADRYTMNLFQQADIYEAFYEVVNGRPAGNGQVMGIFNWGYNYLDEYLFVPDKPASESAMAMDKSGNIRGKPAEAVMQFWNAFR